MERPQVALPIETADTQCYSYDYLRRLTQAWTPGSNDCTAAPTAAGLGGAAPYWQQWSYDATWNRLTQTDHVTANGAASTSYSYPAPGVEEGEVGETSPRRQQSRGTAVRAYGRGGFGLRWSRPKQSGDPKGDD